MEVLRNVFSLVSRHVRVCVHKHTIDLIKLPYEMEDKQREELHIWIQIIKIL